MPTVFKNIGVTLKTCRMLKNYLKKKIDYKVVRTTPEEKE